MLIVNSLFTNLTF